MAQCSECRVTPCECMLAHEEWVTLNLKTPVRVRMTLSQTEDVVLGRVLGTERPLEEVVELELIEQGIWDGLVKRATAAFAKWGG